MKLDEDNPCPHCGNVETLTDRNEDDFQAIIPQNLQFDFKKEISDERNVFSANNQQEIDSNDVNSADIDLPEPPVIVAKRISQDIPLESIMPKKLEGVSLDPASLRVYFQLSIEFQIILDKSANYRDGLYSWNLLLPERLQSYGLTNDSWKIISSVGDSDKEIQKHLTILIKKLFG
ncbi:MAG: hypothetical protein ACXADY_18555 [Candidatus Hodarchaeales archaeon]|jgi:hypothetical protein